MWATNSAGWDFQGADLSCVVCRCINEDVVTQASHPRDLIMVVIVTRADVDRNPVGCFHVVKHVETAGHVAVSGPHIKVGCCSTIESEADPAIVYQFASPRQECALRCRHRRTNRDTVI